MPVMGMGAGGGPPWATLCWTGEHWGIERVASTEHAPEGASCTLSMGAHTCHQDLHPDHLRNITAFPRDPEAPAKSLSLPVPLQAWPLLLFPILLFVLWDHAVPGIRGSAPTGYGASPRLRSRHPALGPSPGSKPGRALLKVKGTEGNIRSRRKEGRRRGVRHREAHNQGARGGVAARTMLNCSFAKSREEPGPGQASSEKGCTEPSGPWNPEAEKHERLITDLKPRSPPCPWKGPGLEQRQSCRTPRCQEQEREVAPVPLAES